MIIKKAIMLWAALACCLGLTVHGAEPLRLSLWPSDAPLGDGTFEKKDPAIFVHLPDPAKATGLAMVICPGGGYGGKVIGPEGHGIARWLNEHGIAGVVLDYRLPAENYHRPLLDVQRAIRMVREHAQEWQLQANGIGIIGFSAGGHLASTAGTHFDAGNPQAPDKVERRSCRPDFLMLVYPVVTMGPKGHGGSRNRFLGSSPTPEMVDLFSNEKQVTAATPPTFLTQAINDSIVPIDNSRMLLTALKAHQVPAELLEFPQGNHGFRGYKGPEWDAWQKRSLEWLKEQYLPKAKEPSPQTLNEPSPPQSYPWVLTLLCGLGAGSMILIGLVIWKYIRGEQKSLQNLSRGSVFSLSSLTMNKIFTILGIIFAVILVIGTIVGATTFIILHTIKPAPNGTQAVAPQTTQAVSPAAAPKAAPQTYQPAVAPAAAAPQAATSGENLVVNGSFEEPTLNKKNLHNLNPANCPGWTFSTGGVKGAGAGIDMGGCYGPQAGAEAHDGSQFACLQSSGNSTVTHLSQAVSGFKVGQTYQLSFWAKAITGFTGANPFKVSLTSGSNKIELFDGKTITPTSTEYTLYTSAPFKATQAVMTLDFADFAPGKFTYVSWIDTVAISPVSGR